MAWFAAAVAVACALLAAWLAQRLTVARREAARARADAEAAREDLASFARHASHELRGPLGAMRTAAMLARDAVQAGRSERALPLLEAIVLQTEGTQAAADALVALARAGHEAFQPAPVPLGPLVRGVVESLRLQGRIGRLEVTVADDLPTVLGDAALLQRLCEQLLDNAARFAREAAAPPRAWVEAAPQDGPGAFAVRDDGIGFAPADAQRIFEPFVRLQGGPDGVGMGLAIVQRLAARHGGAVRAEAPPGGGARFVVRLPPARA